MSPKVVRESCQNLVVKKSFSFKIWDRNINSACRNRNKII